MEHPNRGKRSIGLALEVPSGRDVLLELVREADVFLTNFLPSARQKLRIEVDDIRAVNPNIIYVRGSGHGQRGPEAERPGYDGSTFWSRMGCAWGVTPPDSGRLLGQPSGAFGDSMGGAMMAGGVAAALFARERTGEGSIVDVSLMGVGAWAMALWLGTAMVTGQSAPPLPTTGPMHLAVNPGIGSYRTSDDRFITLMLLQPGRYFADLCKHLDLEHLLEDERFQTAEGLMANADEVGSHLVAAVREQTFTQTGSSTCRRSKVRGRRRRTRSRSSPTSSSRRTGSSFRSSTPTASSASSSPTRCSSTRRPPTVTRARSSPSTPTTSSASSASPTTRSSSSRSTAPAREDAQAAQRCGAQRAATAPRWWRRRQLGEQQVEALRDEVADVGRCRCGEPPHHRVSVGEQNHGGQGRARQIRLGQAPPGRDGAGDGRDVLLLVIEHAAAERRRGRDRLLVQDERGAALREVGGQSVQRGPHRVEVAQILGLGRGTPC